MPDLVRVLALFGDFIFTRRQMLGRTGNLLYHNIIMGFCGLPGLVGAVLFWGWIDKQSIIPSQNHSCYDLPVEQIWVCIDSFS